MLLAGLSVWYAASRLWAVVLFGAGVACFGFEMALKRHSPGGIRSAALHGWTAVVAGIACILLGTLLIAGAFVERANPGTFTK